MKGGIVDLKERLKNRQTLEYWVDYDAEFKLLVEYIPKRKMEAMLEGSKKRGYDKKTHLPTEELDNDKYSQKLASHIKDWDLTLGKLASLVAIDIGDEDPTQSFPFTIENATLLLQEAYGIDNHLSDVMSDIRVFREERQDFLSETSKPTPE